MARKPVHYRAFVDTVTADEAGTPYTIGGEVSLEEYSRFKYGDGDIAAKFGHLVAQRALEVIPVDIDNPMPLLVTSSAYKVAPPASESLLEPFVTTMREELPQAHIEPFKIYRSVLTEGDYASMTLEQREAVMERNGLVLPEGLPETARAVIALDDILVTGSHERMLHRKLDGTIDALMLYCYILDVSDDASNPAIEAAINHIALSSLQSLIHIAKTSSKFIPNARICKMLVGSRPEEVYAFVEEASETKMPLETILEYVEGDELEQMQRYEAGVQALRKAITNKAKRPTVVL
ncbi:MAG: phosphoribosyltransferase family protein [Candidatus Saccharimonadales bacterium]